MFYLTLVARSRAPRLEKPAKAESAAKHERPIDTSGNVDGSLVFPNVRLLHFAHIDARVVQLRADDELCEERI